MPRLALLVLLAACSSTGTTGSTCAATADCATGLSCSGPNDFGGCGIAPREECDGDTGCPGQRCHAIADSCSLDGIGAQCGPACTSDAACGAGFHCPAGACVAIRCDAGFACAAREVCDPSRIAASAPVYDQHHGCFAVSCTSDDACGARSCVNGVCQDGPGTCAKPIAVP